MIPNRLVIDTNVLLDLFVFHDPRWNGLLDALRSGAIQGVTREDCRQEWLHVLHYPHLPLDEEKRHAAIADFDRLIAISHTSDATGTTANAAPLPLCSDRDDQKFLELARDTQAAALVTKDKALLKLAKRTAKAGMFRILTPQAWLQEQPVTLRMTGATSTPGSKPINPLLHTA
jgi:putative PIN family toxin of toxin-antitoxin system